MMAGHDDALAPATTGSGMKRPLALQPDTLPACRHAPSLGDTTWLSRRLHETLVRARDSAAPARAWLDAMRWAQDEAAWCRQRVLCLSCEFEGAREHPDDPARCFMTHAIMSDHHYGLLVTKKQLFCARCVDFVYPRALPSLTEPATPSSHHLPPSTLQLRTPALRRRLLRSSARRGLVNMGNTCFMNAVLQALTHNPLLQHEYFVARTHNTTICEQRRRKKLAQASGEPADSPVCMGCEMSSLLLVLFPAPRATLTARHLTSPVVPQAFLEAFWAHDRSFVGAKQQDAHEFLVSLLNGVHSHTYALAASASAGLKAPAQDAQVVHSPRFSPTGSSLCDCVVHQNFAGVFRSEVLCVFCENVTSTYDPFLDVSLPLESDKKRSPVDDELSLSLLLERFTQAERLKGANQVYCIRCGRYVDVMKRLVLHKLPNVLVFHLKRLDFQSSRKISAAVVFPLRALDLKAFCVGFDGPRATPTKNQKLRKSLGLLSPVTPPAAHAGDASYDLAAVVSHHGDSIDGGHFTTFVHTSHDVPLDGESSSGGAPETTQWLHFDDCDVRPVADADVRRTQAYLLFYVRRRLFT